MPQNSPHCGYDFLSFIKTNDLYEGTDPYNPACKGSQAYNMPCQGPVTACSSQVRRRRVFFSSRGIGGRGRKKKKN